MDVQIEELLKEVTHLRQFVVDLNSCKYEADKMYLLVDREYNKHRDLYKSIKPFDCI